MPATDESTVPKWRPSYLENIKWLPPEQRERHDRRTVIRRVVVQEGLVGGEAAGEKCSGGKEAEVGAQSAPAAGRCPAAPTASPACACCPCRT